MEQRFTSTALFYLSFSLFTLLTSPVYAQETKPEVAIKSTPGIKINPFDGTIVAGCVDNGVFLNFTGPNISFDHKSSKILLGMLPSLRCKEDHGQYKNSPIAPSLGLGITYSYKTIVIQVPVYYNTKTTTMDGNWELGTG